LATVDLNLLTVLDALLATGSVTRAARRLGVTQSAVSHSLARLREHTADALFVRVGARMVPTAYAEQLSSRVTPALAELRRALAHRDRFEPATARRVFTVIAAEYPEIVLVPPLVARAALEAPGVDVHVRRASDDELAAFARGEGDVVLAVREAHVESMRQRVLLDDPFVVFLRAGHPALASELTVERFAALHHVLVSPRGGPKGGVVDDALRRLGLARRIVVRVPNFASALQVVAASDAVTTLPSRIATALGGAFDLAVVKLPLDVPPVRITCLWHERHHADAAQEWLRGALAAIAGEAARGSGNTFGASAPRRAR